MADPSDIRNWRRLDARITTSGQPDEAQLAALKTLGVTDVVNLGLSTSPGALPDERASVEALGMAYRHIPVDFQDPTEADFAQFSAVMAELAGRTTHVHCIANYRVTAFLYRYRRDVLGVAEAEARALMDSVWTPEGVWAAFVATPEA